MTKKEIELVGNYIQGEEDAFHQLDRYVSEKWPGENANLNRYEMVLNYMGKSFSNITKGMKVPGSPFLRLPSR